MTMMIMVQGRHKADIGIKGYFIDPWPIPGTGFYIELRLAGEHLQRGFHGVAMNHGPAIPVADTGIVAQGRGPRHFRQHRAGICRSIVAANCTLKTVALAGDIEALATGHCGGHHHFVTGQGSGLVGTDHRHRTQGFDDRHTPDHGLAASHLAHTNGQGNGQNRGQALGNGRNGEPHHRHEQLPELQAAERQAAEENRHPGQDDNNRQHPGKPVHLLQQGRFQGGRAGQKAGNPANLGTGAGTHHHTPAGSGGHHGAGKGHAGLVTQGSLGLHRLGSFIHRLGFAGQDGFFNFQVVALFQADIRRYTVTRFQQNGIARHQFCCIHLVLAIVPDNPGFRRQHVPDSRQRLFGPPFLQKADQGLDDHHRQDDPGIDPVAEGTGNHHRGHQHIDQEILQLPAKAGKRAGCGRFRQTVVAQGDQAFSGFGVG